MTQIAGKVFHKIKCCEEIFCVQFQVQCRDSVMVAERAVCQIQYLLSVIFFSVEPIF